MGPFTKELLLIVNGDLIPKTYQPLKCSKKHVAHIHDKIGHALEKNGNIGLKSISEENLEASHKVINKKHIRKNFDVKTRYFYSFIELFYAQVKCHNLIIIR